MAAICLGWAGGSNSHRFLGVGADASSVRGHTSPPAVSAKSAKPANVASNSALPETPKPSKDCRQQRRDCSTGPHAICRPSAVGRPIVQSGRFVATRKLHVGEPPPCAHLFPKRGRQPLPAGTISSKDAHPWRNNTTIGKCFRRFRIRGRCGSRDVTEVSDFRANR